MKKPDSAVSKKFLVYCGECEQEGSMEARSLWELRKRLVSSEVCPISGHMVQKSRLLICGEVPPS